MGRNPESNNIFFAGKKLRAGLLAFTLIPSGGIGLLNKTHDSGPVAAFRESAGATHVSSPPTTVFVREESSVTTPPRSVETTVSVTTTKPKLTETSVPKSADTTSYMGKYSAIYKAAGPCSEFLPKFYMLFTLMKLNVRVMALH